MAKHTESELLDPLGIAMGTFRTVAHFLIFKAGLPPQTLHGILDEMAQKKGTEDG